MTAPSAQEILRLEYGNSQNLMTPKVTAVGKLADGVAYEISSGTGIEHEPIFGVSIVVWDRGETHRCFGVSKIFHSAPQARSYVTSLRLALGDDPEIWKSWLKR